MMRTITVAFTALLLTTHTFACSCFGPETFCSTLNPPYEDPIDPAWWIPDAIVLGVKVAQEAHGMDVRVIETLSGVPQAEDVLRVWGDCGLLCRVYPDAWEIGDTVIWALKYTDLMGNGMCGTELEQEGEWMISVCGTYYLDYQGGVVTGAIAEGVSELPYGDFLQFMSSCLATSIPEAQEEIPVEVSIIGMDLVFKVNGPIDGMSYDLYDAAGKQIGLGAVNAQTMNVPLANVSAGVLFLKLSDGIRSRTLKVVRP